MRMKNSVDPEFSQDCPVALDPSPEFLLMFLTKVTIRKTGHTSGSHVFQQINLF